jgi:hypothetical protein
VTHPPDSTDITDHTGAPGPRVVLPAGLGPDDLDPLRALVRRLAAADPERGGAGGGSLVTCDLSAVRKADLGLVDLVARLRLEARRAGGDLVVADAAPEVVRLVALVGLADELLLPRRRTGL